MNEEQNNPSSGEEKKEEQGESASAAAQENKAEPMIAAAPKEELLEAPKENAKGDTGASQKETPIGDLKDEWRERKQEFREERRRLRQEWRMHRQSGRCFNFGRFLLGIIVIFFGITLLAKAFGIFPDNFVFDFFRFWPLLIVAFGLSLLDTRNKLACAIGFLVLILIVIMMALSLRHASLGNGTVIHQRIQNDFHRFAGSAHTISSVID